MNPNEKGRFDPKVFLAKIDGGGRTISDYRKDQIVFRQGDPSDAVFYIQSGKVKKTVVSEQGKEAVVALLGAGDFFGEGCLAGEALRLSTVSALTKCVIARMSKAEITRVIHEEPAFAELFISHLLARNGRVEEDLVDQLFNSSEKEASCADSSAFGEFWQGGSAGTDHRKSQPGDACGDDWNDPVPGEFLHEQISKTGLN
jgi:CRP/FNR family transcriptional regulator, cyclic AMP receptor protein